MMTEPGSFAQKTLNERLPAIVHRIIAENDFPPAIVVNLETLLQDVVAGTVRSLNDDAADGATWADDLTPYLGKSWLDVPWFFAEVYFFRRLLEATHYFQPGDWQAVDPFHTQKQAGLKAAIADIRTLSTLVKGAIAPAPDQSSVGLSVLIYSVLWGNQADLSLRPGETAATVQSSINAHTQQTHILVDDTPAVLAWLEGRSHPRIDVVADNAGFELVCDLCLIDVLLTNQIVNTVHLHLKSHPIFVSDAIVADLYATLAMLSNDTHPDVQSLAARLRSHVDYDRLCLGHDPFWTAPRVFWQMPRSLQQELAQADLVVVKGDANYRRLLGDCHWPFTTSFADIVCYFPTPLLALRTLKSEVVAGLQQTQIDALSHEDTTWLTDGQWGLIQFVPAITQ